MPFISAGDLPDPGIEHASPELAGRFFTTKPPGKPPPLRILLHNPINIITISVRAAQKEIKFKDFPGGPVDPPLETRTDSPGETPEVPQYPFRHWRGILRFRHRLHTRS